MDQRVVDLAAGTLGVRDLTPLREGGQKYVAKCKIDDTDLAVIKIVALQRVANAGELLERAKREVALLTDIDDPSLVRVRTQLTMIGDPPVAVAWLEEYLDGEDLIDRLVVPWKWKDVRALGVSLARGLQLLHERDVVHRDLSPNNVRCLSDGTYVIMDPGYGRHLARSTLTVAGQPGTPGFLSPEHLTKGGPIPSSDVFGVGILMFAALTGDLPFPLTADVNAYQDALRTQRAPSVQSLRPDIPLEGAAVVDRCLDLQPARRFLDGAELGEALEGTPE